MCGTKVKTGCIEISLDRTLRTAGRALLFTSTALFVGFSI